MWIFGFRWLSAGPQLPPCASHWLRAWTLTEFARAATAFPIVLAKSFDALKRLPHRAVHAAKGSTVILMAEGAGVEPAAHE